MDFQTRQKDSKIFCYPFIVPKKSLRATPLAKDLVFIKNDDSIFFELWISCVRIKK